MAKSGIHRDAGNWRAGVLFYVPDKTIVRRGTLWAMIGLRLGVVAFLDVLGFKGIWKREQPRLVLEKLPGIRRKGRELQGADHAGSIVVDDGFEHRVKCVSDTVIVVVAPKGKDCTERMMYKAMFSATWIAGSMMTEALRGELPLMFRGCLGVGPMKMAGDFLIGPAVDETASLFEMADGPFFWMSPSALALNDEYAPTFFERIEPALMTRYAVPLKGGERIQTMAYTYFGVRCSSDYWASVRHGIDEAFGQEPLAPQIKRKYSNTSAFLNHIESVARKDDRRVSDMQQPYWDDLTRSQRFQILKHGGMDAPDKFPRRGPKGIST